jgi:hypothetical protein
VPTYRERLSPPWWAWLIALGWAATLGIAYGYAISDLVGLLAGALAFGLAALGLWQAGSVVLVDDHRLRAGRAELPAWAIGSVTVLGRDDARRIRGTGADARAFMLLRGWIATAVSVEVRDEADPTPYWFVSSRRPERLAAALEALTDAAASNGSGMTRSGPPRKEAE